MKDQNLRDYIMIIGVFDLISRKIRENISKAASEGIPVAVGVLTDDFVKDYLLTVPLKSTEERMDVASGIEGVSFVFPAKSNILEENKKIADDYYKEYMANIKENLEVSETKKYKVGIVIGSFDLYHSGHHQNLELSHKLCDHLYVLLKSSARILEKKGVMPQQNDEIRSEVLRSLRVVDGVIPYDIDSTRELAIQDVIKKHQQLFHENLSRSDIVAIFGDDLREKETERWNNGDWCGINVAFTPREKEKMRPSYLGGRGVSSSSYRAKLKAEGEEKRTSAQEAYLSHRQIENEGLISDL